MRNFNQQQPLRSLALAGAALGMLVVSCGSDDEPGSADTAISTAVPSQAPVAETLAGGLETAPPRPIDSPEAALVGQETVGVVPGIITFTDGTVVVRPLAETELGFVCEGGDMAIHDDTSTLTYLSDGEVISRAVSEVAKVQIDKDEYVAADSQVTEFILRECITAEAEVYKDDDGYCVPVGVPNPASETIAVATKVPEGLAQGVKDSNC